MPEEQMEQFAQGALAAHGELTEVIFLKGDNEDSLLVFADGNVIPVLHHKYGYGIRGERYVYETAAQLSGQDPFDFLRFGYSGTGPRHYRYFLSAAGFADCDVTVINGPVRLKRDGRKVQGIAKDDGVEWEDGSATPSVKKWYQFWK